MNCGRKTPRASNKAAPQGDCKNAFSSPECRDWNSSFDIIEWGVVQVGVESVEGFERFAQQFPGLLFECRRFDQRFP